MGCGVDSWIVTGGVSRALKNQFVTACVCACPTANFGNSWCRVFIKYFWCNEIFLWCCGPNTWCDVMTPL